MQNYLMLKILNYEPKSNDMKYIFTVMENKVHQIDQLKNVLDEYLAPLLKVNDASIVVTEKVSAYHAALKMLNTDCGVTFKVRGRKITGAQEHLTRRDEKLSSSIKVYYDNDVETFGWIESIDQIQIEYQLVEVENARRIVTR